MSKFLTKRELYIRFERFLSFILWLIVQSVANLTRLLHLSGLLLSQGWKRIVLKTRLLFINTRASITESASRVGERLVRMASRLPLYSPITIYDCTLERYMSIMFDGKIKRVLRRGWTTRERAEELVSDLCRQFQEAQGNDISSAYTEMKQKLLALSVECQRLSIARMLVVRDFAYACSIVRSLRLPISSKTTQIGLLRVIDSQINMRESKMRELTSTLESKKRGDMSKQDYIDSIVRLGVATELGYKTDATLTLSEFASILKINKEKAKAYEQIKRKSGSSKR